ADKGNDENQEVWYHCHPSDFPLSKFLRITFFEKQGA
ncbi:unnamed protein product, partial [marine sediment metagenome]